MNKNKDQEQRSRLCSKKHSGPKGALQAPKLVG